MAALTAPPPATPAETRPDADYSLTDEAAEVWHATLSALPSGWIGAEALPVLAAFCRQTVALRRLGALIAQEERADAYDLDRHLALIRAHGAAAQVLKTLATSLRLTPQTRLRADAAGRTIEGRPTGPRPWETGCTDD
jgi:hypothetical protein